MNVPEKELSGTFFFNKTQSINILSKELRPNFIILSRILFF